MRRLGATVSSAPGYSTRRARVLVSAAIAPIVQAGNAYVAGAIVGALVTCTAASFASGFLAAVGAVATARWAGLPWLELSAAWRSAV